jgi:hypothetical protein
MQQDKNETRADAIATCMENVAWWAPVGEFGRSREFHQLGVADRLESKPTSAVDWIRDD